MNNLPLIIASIIFNYFISLKLNDETSAKRRFIFILGITVNIALLIFYKYTDFILTNIGILSNQHIDKLNIALPLGISFFTITQIAYLSDVYMQQVKEYKIDNYALFVTFFPHLLAGPILHHREMMPQFSRMRNKVINTRNISKALVLLSIGLFKKVIIADSLSQWADYGFDTAAQLTFADAWITSLSYTFQIYFDFSGYTDMALGSSLLFNIHLPLNFDSPYKALNIQDFWRRWHMTLSRFLRDYLYIPLGGNRMGSLRTDINILTVFIIGGLWHGAGWGFLIWGALHGIAYTIYNHTRRITRKIPDIAAWFIMFSFINITWIFFRARTLADAKKVLTAMSSFAEIKISSIIDTVMSLLLNALNIIDNDDKFSAISSFVNMFGGELNKMTVLFICLILCLFTRNSNDIYKGFYATYKNAIFYGLCAVTALLMLKSEKIAKFLYFNF